MKRYVIALISLLLVLGLVSCGPDPDPVPSPAPALDEARVLNDIDLIDSDIKAFGLKLDSSAFNANDLVSGKLDAQFSNDYINYYGSYSVKYEDAAGELKYVSSTKDTRWDIKPGNEFTRSSLEEYIGEPLSNTTCVASDHGCIWYYDTSDGKSVQHCHADCVFDPVKGIWEIADNCVDSEETIVNISDYTNDGMIFLYKEFTETSEGTVVKGWPVGYITFTDKFVSGLKIGDNLGLTKYTDQWGHKYTDKVTVDYMEYYAPGKTLYITDPNREIYYWLVQQKNGSWMLMRNVEGEDEDMMYLKSAVYVLFNADSDVTKMNYADGSEYDETVDDIGPLFKKCKCYGFLCDAIIKNGVVKYMTIEHAIKN